MQTRGEHNPQSIVQVQLDVRYAYNTTAHRQGTPPQHAPQVQCGAMNRSAGVCLPYTLEGPQCVKRRRESSRRKLVEDRELIKGPGSESDAEMRSVA